MKTTPRRGLAAFTLIELMAVITIIVILAGIVVGGMGYVNEKQARARAKVQIELLSKALEEYKMDMGTYPPTVDTADGKGQTTDSLYAPLFYEGYEYSLQESPPADWTKTINGMEFPKATRIYLPDLDPTTSKQGWMDGFFAGQSTPPAPKKTGPHSTILTDPWGNEYCYRTAIGLPDEHGVSSPNPNTQNPDFDLWSMGKDRKTHTDPKHADSLDDIRNF